VLPLSNFSIFLKAILITSSSSSSRHLYLPYPLQCNTNLIYSSFLKLNTMRIIQYWYLWCIDFHVSVMTDKESCRCLVAHHSHFIITSRYALWHGCPTRGPPSCVMRSAATFVNYIYRLLQKITQQCKRFGTPGIVILHERPAKQPTVTVVALCQPFTKDGKGPHPFLWAVTYHDKKSLITGLHFTLLDQYILFE
jgi:hypothetical protein